jgi:hypothetical protein
MSVGRTSFSTNSTILRPEISAAALRRESDAGMAAAPGSVMPNPSVTHAMVDAVPIVIQWP